MKIVPIEIKFKALYEHRHLLTNDVKYNSLIVSNIINQDIMLLDNKLYDTLDDSIKEKIYFMYIIHKDGLTCYFYNKLTSTYTEDFNTWEQEMRWEIPESTFNILTIVM